MFPALRTWCYSTVPMPAGTPAAAASHFAEGARDSQCIHVPLRFTVQKRDRFVVPRVEGTHPVSERYTLRHSIRPAGPSIMKTSPLAEGGGSFPPPLM